MYQHYSTGTGNGLPPPWSPEPAIVIRFSKKSWDQPKQFKTTIEQWKLISNIPRICLEWLQSKAPVLPVEPFTSSSLQNYYTITRQPSVNTLAAPLLSLGCKHINRNRFTHSCKAHRNRSYTLKWLVTNVACDIPWIQVIYW